MSDAVTKPVWVWTAGAVEPVRCGSFTWREGLGEFTYDRDFMFSDGATPLDPVNLPFTRALRPHREFRQKGLFGVLRDASPEGYGLSMLENREGRALNPIDRLEVSLGDGVGAIEVCDDIQRKIDFQPIPLDQFLQKLAEAPEGVAPSRVVRDLHGVVGTTLGGERPKLTVTHSGQLWIAKLQDCGDAPNSPLREYLAMRSARACGIDAATVEFQRAGQHQIIAVRRFDRLVRDDDRVLRQGFASAHTMLRLDSAATRGDPQRSYPYLCAELQRWCGADGADILAMKRELWRRMAFNALCANGDDHPRNHGVLCAAGRWSLAPAYDIAPYITFNKTLAMSITRDGHMQAARWALLRDCETFGYAEEEGRHAIDLAIGTLTQTWAAERAALGFTADDAPTPTPEKWLDASPPTDLAPRRRPRARRR
jgi:serine/threonine-protein kinase HipA